MRLSPNYHHRRTEDAFQGVETVQLQPFYYFVDAPLKARLGKRLVELPRLEHVMFEITVYA